MAWGFRPRVLVLGMGRFQGFCSFTLSVGNANISIVREVCYLHRYSPSQIMHYCELSVRKDPGGGISLVTPHGGEDGKLEGVHFLYKALNNKEYMQSFCAFKCDIYKANLS